MVLVCSMAEGQELSIGPTGGALFTQGSHGYEPGMHGNGFGTTYSVGGEVVYSLSSLLRLDVGASYSLNGPFDRGRNLSTIGFGASVLFTLF